MYIYFTFFIYIEVKLNRNRVIRFLVIGSFHSSLYLYVLPHLILPSLRPEAKFVASIMTTMFSILVTFIILRFLKPRNKL